MLNFEVIFNLTTRIFTLHHFERELSVYLL